MSELSHDAGAPSPAAPSRGTRLALGLALVAAVALIAAFAIQLRRPTTGPRPGAAAPPFAFETLDGDGISLEALQGEVVVLNFWASWCVSCVYEAPDLEQVWQDYRDRGVVVLGVAYNDTRPAARTYIAEHGITYPNGMDPGGAVSQAYRLSGVPETAVIDQNGNVVPLQRRDERRPVGKIVGPITSTSAFTPDDLRITLEGLLADGAT